VQIYKYHCRCTGCKCDITGVWSRHFLFHFPGGC